MLSTLPARPELIRWPHAEPPSETAVWQQLDREGFDVYRWQDGPEAAYGEQCHDHEETVWLLDGEMVFSADGEEYRLGPGDCLVLPPGTPHVAQVGSAGATYLIGEYRR